jgi:hypothetical protein
MKSRAIKIEKVSLRLRGVTPEQAHQRAVLIAGEIAHAAAREQTPTQTEVPRLSLRLRADGKGPGVAEQIHRQWNRE